MASAAHGGDWSRPNGSLSRDFAAKAGRRTGIVTAMVAGLALLFLIGCSFDYGDQGPPPEGQPTAVFVDFFRSDVVNGRRSFEVYAEKAAYFDLEKKIVLENIRFMEYDAETGALRTKGASDHVVYHTDSGDAELSGFVSLYSADEDAVFETDYLRYNGTQKTLEGRLDRSVMVKVGKGSWIRGAGFFADTVARSFALRDGVEGRMVDNGQPGSDK